MGLEILKIYEPQSGIGCEKQGQTLFFDPSVMHDCWIEWNGTAVYNSRFTQFGDGLVA